MSKPEWSPMAEPPLPLRNDAERDTCVHAYPNEECLGPGPSGFFGHAGRDASDGLLEGLKQGMGGGIKIPDGYPWGIDLDVKFRSYYGLAVRGGPSGALGVFGVAPPPKISRWRRLVLRTKRTARRVERWLRS